MPLSKLRGRPQTGNCTATLDARGCSPSNLHRPSGSPGPRACSGRGGGTEGPGTLASSVTRRVFKSRRMPSWLDRGQGTSQLLQISNEKDSWTPGQPPPPHRAGAETRGSSASSPLPAHHRPGHDTPPAERTCVSSIRPGTLEQKTRLFCVCFAVYKVNVQ